MAFGRAARNLSGKVLLYADTETGSMRAATAETRRRRERQLAYNREHGITPESVRKAVAGPIGQACDADYLAVPTTEPAAFGSRGELARTISRLRKGMERAARKLDFERAAELRDRILALEMAELVAG